MKLSRRELFTGTGSIMGGLAAIFAGVKAQARDAATKVFAARHVHDPHGVFSNGFTRRYDPVKPR